MSSTEKTAATASPQKSPKVLVVVSYVLPHMGGIEIVAQTQAKLLASKGAKVDMLTSAYARPGGTSTEPEGHHIHRVKIWNFTEEKFGAPFPIFAPTLFWKARRLVREADVVHAHDAFYISSLAAAFWARRLGKPFVLTQHVAEIPHPKKVVTIAQKIIYGTSGTFIFKTADHVAVLNANVRDFLLAHGVPAERIFVLPNGVDVERFRPAKSDTEKRAMRKKYNLPDDGKPLAIFVGRFVPKKGFDKLLQAGSDAYRIVFVGGNAPDTKIAKNPRFIFMGGRTPAEVAELYRACDMFVLPSVGEGFPLTIQEAMASGLPVITTNDPGYDIYNFDGEIKLINPTVKNIQKTLAELASNPDERAKMGKRAYDFAQKHFTWEQNIAALTEIYRKVIK